jgi:hypothetical protein
MVVLQKSLIRKYLILLNIISCATRDCYPDRRTSGG